jgi:protoporphyrinogen/coproporphyrinogen III oxidase
MNAAGEEHYDVVVVGASVAGLAAARELSHRNAIVLEATARVGGNAASGGDHESWFDSVAPLLGSDQLVELTGDLGLEVVRAKPAEFAFAVGGSFARGRSPEQALARLGLPLAQKADLGRASLRLRRRLRAPQARG